MLVSWKKSLCRWREGLSTKWEVEEDTCDKYIAIVFFLSQPVFYQFNWTFWFDQESTNLTRVDHVYNVIGLI